MQDLTVIILTKNEEKNIEKCIKSFKNIVKRFVIVDSYSTDSTKKICAKIDKEISKFGSKLDFYEHEWIDYANQFNWALDNTNINTLWIMRMDADEELTPELANEISLKINKIEPDINGIILKRRIYFMHKWIRHGGRYPEYLLRIFKNKCARCELRAMDEHIILDNGRTIKFKFDIIDNNTKNLEWWISKHNWYSNREVFDYQNNLSSVDSNNLDKNGISTNQAKRKRIIKNKGYYKLPLFFRSHLYFIYRYYFRLGFLDGKEGKIFHFLQAYWYRFLVDAKIYECEKNNVKMIAQKDLKS